MMERVTDVPESLAESAERDQVNDYDRFAEAYSAETENSLVNAYYARPAMPALLGDVAGRRILDAGCGSGPLSAALRDRGAVVTGIDISAGMLALARRRPGDAVALHVADLNDRLPFATVRSTTWSRRWCCTTWRTGGRRRPRYGGCSGPAAG